jgi:hypothetical protein
MFLFSAKREYSIKKIVAVTVASKLAIVSSNVGTDIADGSMFGDCRIVITTIGTAAIKEPTTGTSDAKRIEMRDDRKIPRPLPFALAVAMVSHVSNCLNI